MTGTVHIPEDYFVAKDRYITAGDDLNNYLTVGRYTCSSASASTQVSNLPSGAGAGQLIVTDAIAQTRKIVPGQTTWRNFLQWYIPMTGSVYVRLISTGSDGMPVYHVWKKFLLEETA